MPVHVCFVCGCVFGCLGRCFDLVTSGESECSMHRIHTRVDYVLHCPGFRVLAIVLWIAHVQYMISEQLDELVVIKHDDIGVYFDVK